MKVGETPVACVADDPQHLGMQPGALDKERREGSNQVISAAKRAGRSGMAVPFAGNMIKLDHLL